MSYSKIDSHQSRGDYKTYVGEVTDERLIHFYKKLNAFDEIMDRGRQKFIDFDMIPWPVLSSSESFNIKEGDITKNRINAFFKAALKDKGKEEFKTLLLHIAQIISKKNWDDGYNRSVCPKDTCIDQIRKALVVASPVVQIWLDAHIES